MYDSNGPDESTSRPTAVRVLANDRAWIIVGLVAVAIGGSGMGALSGTLAVFVSAAILGAGCVAVMHGHESTVRYYRSASRRSANDPARFDEDSPDA